MTLQSTRVLIVDDSERSRDKLIEMLRFEDIEVVGESTFGAAAFTWAQQLDVDVIIVAVEEPVARSLRTVEALSTGARSWPVVGVSSRGEREIMRKAMVSGVRDFVVLPVPPEELRATVVNVRHVDRARRAAAGQESATRALGTVITVAGFKGGIGKSTVSSNVAVSLAQQTKQHVALIDLDLQFGDAAVMLDIVPANTIYDAASEAERLDPQLLQGYLSVHASRLKVLAAPTTPEAADEISDETAGRILEQLAATNDYVVVDTAPHLDGLAVAAMDLSTIVLVVVVPEIPCIRRTKAALSLMQSWGYSRDKVKLVVNRAQKRGAVSVQEIEQVLNYPVFARIPEDRSVAKGIAVGTPVAMSAPNSKAGRASNDLARTISGVSRYQSRPGLLGRLQKAEPQFGRPILTLPQTSSTVPTSWGGSDPRVPAPNAAGFPSVPHSNLGPHARDGHLTAAQTTPFPVNGGEVSIEITTPSMNGSGPHTNGVVSKFVQAGAGTDQTGWPTGGEE